MKCLIFCVLYLASLISNVYSLGLNASVLSGKTAVVFWNREGSDPSPLHFDLRYIVPPCYDQSVELVKVNPSLTEFSGNTTVQLPGAGSYIFVALSEDNLELGRTTEIEISESSTPSQVSSQVPTPSQSSRPTPSLTVLPSSSKASSSLKKKANVAAIILALFGGISLTIILFFTIVFLRRRAQEDDRRISFHGERMVQDYGNNPSVGRDAGWGGVMPYNSKRSRTSFGSGSSLLSLDVEHGLAVPPPAIIRTSRHVSPMSRTPLPSGYVVPPPRGPRDRANSVRRIETPRSPRTPLEPTSRQKQLSDRLTEVENDIRRLKSQSRPRPSDIVVLEDLELQKSWLIKQRYSMWAMEEIDTPPPGHSRYMRQ